MRCNRVYYESILTRSLLPFTVLAAVALAAPSAGAVAGRPRVDVSDLTPFTVEGRGFHAHERVVVNVSAPRRTTKTVVASSRGAFGVRFATVEVGACPSYAVTAVGDKGSRASTKARAVDCAQPADSP